MIDMEQLLVQYKIPYMKTGQHHHARDGWLQLDCPLCSPGEGRYRLGYMISGRYFSCWSCGPKNTEQTIRLLFKISNKTSKNLIKQIKKEKFEKVEVQGVFKPPDHLLPLQKAHIQYLQKRKFNPETLVKLWNIKATTNLSGILNWRIYIPILYQGKSVSWTTRSIIEDDEVRYRTAKKEDEAIFHKNLLYGEDYCRTDSIIVHEGPFDVWRTGPGSTCTFGTNYSLKQLHKIGKYKVRCICFDSTKEGQKAAMQLVNQLSIFPGDTYNVVLDSKDMGEGTRKERKKLRSQFLWPVDD